MTKNPWLQETRNLTEQYRILANDPALAEKLRNAAGVASTAMLKRQEKSTFQGNPWKKETRNLTMQSKIAAEDP
ncbi:MAG: hypothetical protein M0P70_08540 [Desulfobulbaceae bacterium]|nr:hypothetical protein [Desulfobulbaceae bacterium]